MGSMGSGSDARGRGRDGAQRAKSATKRSSRRGDSASTNERLVSQRHPDRSTHVILLIDSFADANLDFPAISKRLSAKCCHTSNIAGQYRGTHSLGECHEIFVLGHEVSF